MGGVISPFNVTPGGTAGGDLSGSYPNPTVKSAAGDFTTTGKLFVGGTAASQIDGQLIVSGSQSNGMLFIANSVPTTGEPGNISVQESSSTNKSFALFVSGDSNPRYQINAAGNTVWGPGNGATDTTLSRTGVGVLTITGLAVTNLTTLNGGTATSGSAPVITPTFANGTAAQLSDTTRDYMVYLQIGTAGTAFTLAVGPTSGVANTLMASATPLADELLVVRLPAGWFLKWAGTSTTLTTQTAIGC